MTTESGASEQILVRRHQDNIPLWPGGQHAYLLQEIKQYLSGLRTEFCPSDGLWDCVLCMSALAERLACMCGTLNRSWGVSLVTPWGPGPILTAKKNWIKEEEETACIRDAFRGVLENTLHYLPQCTAAQYAQHTPI